MQNSNEKHQNVHIVHVVHIVTAKSVRHLY